MKGRRVDRNTLKTQNLDRLVHFGVDKISGPRVSLHSKWLEQNMDRGNLCYNAS
jgi:hypothetical protein